MSDNLNRYLAISNALIQACPTAPTGNHRRHLHTLAALIGGIVGSQKTRLSAIANKMPGKVQRESRIKRLTRFIGNKRITPKTYFHPAITRLLKGFPSGSSQGQEALILVMDGSEVGRGCLALVVSVLFGKRALPLGWIVVSGKKGHFPQETHIRLIEQVVPLLPEGRPIIFWGDGEFDGCGLLEVVQKQGWQFVCRTAKNVRLTEEEVDFGFADLAVAPGETVSIPEVMFTAQGFGPVMVIAHWDSKYKEPWYLVTNLELAEEAAAFYRKRYGIETFFSDVKSRGFHLCHSHISDPEHMDRLMIAASLAYIWVVYLGTIVAKQATRLKQIHRTHRRDLSLFQLGMAWIDECLNRDENIPACFVMPALKSVRW